MTIQTNISLQTYNTFGLACMARRYAAIQNKEDLAPTLSLNADTFHETPLVLGGGSNILFTKPFYDGLVLHMQTKGIRKIDETNQTVILSVAAGELWSDIVDFTVAKGWGGMENLAAIPGTVGAAPVQNIGAYGVEVKDIIYSIEVIDLHSGTYKTFLPEDCAFGYRQSIFKQFRGRFIVTEVVFRLNKQPELHLSYGAIELELNAMGCLKPSVQDIRKAVIRIRNAKLPDPTQWGNAGSFFTNPIITQQAFLQLQQRYPKMPSYLIDRESRKLSAGWLIEQAGWKGRSLGRAAVYDKQALVLINKGNATAQDILILCERITKDVEEMFGVTLESEVNRY